MTVLTRAAAAGIGLESPSQAAVGRTLERVGYATICAFLFNIPWGEGVLLGGGVVLGSWLGMLAFAVIALRVAVLSRIRRPWSLHYCMVAFVGWSVLSLFWTQEWDSSVTRSTTYLQLLAAVWLIWELGFTRERIEGMLGSYASGALLASGITVYNFLRGETAAKLAAEEGRHAWEASRYSVAGVNENDLGLMLALSIPVAFYLLAATNRRWVKAVCWLQIASGYTSILLTASRGSLAAGAVGFLMFPLTFFRMPKWQRAASVPVLIAVAACAAYFVPPTSWKRILQFGAEVSQGTLTHRTVIWAAGMEMFRAHPWLGVGTGAYPPVAYKIIDIPLAAHNTFISILVELGVIGAMVFAALLGNLFYCALRMRYLERCLWITVLLTWCLGVQALTWEYRKPTWMLFGILAAQAALPARMRRSSAAASRPAPLRTAPVRPDLLVVRAQLKEAESVQSV
jgi:O-antigen ligase